MNSVKLFENSLEWLKKNYPHFRFYLERDIVYTLQTYLNDVIDKNSLPFKAYNDYPILPGIKRHLCADLVIKANNEKSDIIDIAVEFKYEPDHGREDLYKKYLKFPVVSLNGKKYSVASDIKRAQKYVQMQNIKHAYSIFIDEGKYFYEKSKAQKLFLDKWERWGKIAVLIARFKR